MFIFEIHAQDSLVQKISLIVGTDIVGPIQTGFTPGKKNFELSFSVGSYKNIYGNAEIGYMNIDEKKEKFSYKAGGSFLRIGFEYNIFNKNMPWENNRILVGARYGFSQFYHQAEKITIKDSFWGEYTGQFSKTDVSAQWAEVTLNLRGGITKRFSMGWGIQFRLLTTSKGMRTVKPSYIPGFGKGNSNTALGFTYSIYYSFPVTELHPKK